MRRPYPRGRLGRMTIAYGAWTDGMDASPELLGRLGRTLGVDLTIASVFRGRGDEWPYPVDRQLGADESRTLLVAWDPTGWGDYSWWASGQGDDVVRDHARRCAAYEDTIVIRPWAEMNGDWTTFQPGAIGHESGGTPAEFVAAWQRVVEVVRSIAPNVTFCFNPTTDTYAGTTDVRDTWPGRSYVDVLGLDGYNWGEGDGLRWRTFADIYREQYDRLVTLAPDLPVWICEISCADTESAGNGLAVTGPPADGARASTKGQWWIDMGEQLADGFTKVEAVCFFDADKERNWRVDSSPEALTGLRQMLQALR